MKKIELKALAKINLGLDILGKRPDGYHDVKMVMQTVWLYDNVTIKRRKKKGVSLSSNLFFLPCNEKNIAYKAAQMIIDDYGINEGVEIILDKHIPVSAGLAGGSSDAAAVLFGMNILFDLGLNKKTLMEKGVLLGADVPYCILRGTVLAEGIGEKLTRLKNLKPCYVVLAKPPVNVSTAKVYEEIDSAIDIKHPDIDGLIEGIENEDFKMIAEKMGNVLEEVTEKNYKVITVIKEKMMENGAIQAMMSGSGPTVFGLFKSRGDAKRARKAILKEGLTRKVYVTNTHTIKARGNNDDE